MHSPYSAYHLYQLGPTEHAPILSTIVSHLKDNPIFSISKRED
jgi:hypothetical protein